MFIEAHVVVVAGLVIAGSGDAACASINCGETAETGGDDWDITLEEFDNGRRAYEEEVIGIKDEAQKMLEDGYTLDEVAEWANNRRREIGIKYKNLTPPDMREEIYKRNIEKYGDPLGPDIDYFLDKGYTPQEIIDSASRPRGEDIVPILRERIKNNFR